MRDNMTQEELAERLDVSRQTVSKWELDAAYPEMDKLLALCDLFSCSLDQLIREDMNIINEAYSNIRIEEVEAFRYIRYAVISPEPEDDAIAPFELIPNAYKVLMAYMNANGYKGKWDGHIVDCFEKEYELEGVWHMDVYIAVE